MARFVAPSISVSRLDVLTPGSDTDRSVVQLFGDHDIATTRAVVAAITGAAQRDDADVVVDLSGVTFMDASTLGALVGSNNRLQACGHALQVRDPSPPAARILELCGLGQLIARRAVCLEGAGTVLAGWGEDPITQPIPDWASHRGGVPLPDDR